jgi:hypothetical protein
VPVPVTLALHCEVAPGATVAGVQVTETAETVPVAAACTATVALPDLVVSWVLVAVTVALPPVAAAVKSPFASMVPPFAVQVTVGAKVPVPVTAALHCDVDAGAIVVGAHVTATPEIVEATSCTDTAAWPDFVASCALTAVTVTLPDDDGAVNMPVASTDPPLAVHVTAEL